MRHAARLILLLIVTLPLSLHADIKADMAEGYLSTAQVIQNAAAEGIPIGDIVDAMIRADRARTAEIISEAIRLQPDQLQLIIAAAVYAGVDPGDLVTIALAATPDERTEEVVQAVANAAPPSARRSIADAATAVIPASGDVVKELAITRVPLGAVGDHVNDSLSLVRVLVTPQTASQAMDLGWLKIIPNFDATATRESNIYSTRADAQDSYVTRLGAALQFIRNFERAAGAVTYKGDFGAYEYEPDDSYNDHRLSADYVVETGGVNFQATGAVVRDHDARGTRASAGAPLTRSKPDRYEIRGFSSTAEFATTSPVGLGFDVGAANLEYLNNRAATSHLDRRVAHGIGRIFLRVSPSIRFFGEYGRETFTYDMAPAGAAIRDSVEQSFGGGIKWNLGRKSFGELKIGTAEKKFDDTSRAKYRMVTWTAALKLAAGNSVVALTSTREPLETYTVGDFVESRDLSMGCAYQWTDRLGVNYYVRYAQNNHVEDARSDKVGDLGLSFNYHWRRFAGLSLFANRASRDSTVDIYDFQGNAFGLKLDLSL